MMRLDDSAVEFGKMLRARVAAGLPDAATVEGSIRNFLSDPAHDLISEAARISEQAGQEKRLMTEAEKADFDAAMTAAEALLDARDQLSFLDPATEESRPVRQKAMAAFQRAQAITAKASLSKGDQIAFDALTKEIDGLLAQAERLERKNPPEAMFHPEDRLFNLELRQSAGEAFDLAGELEQSGLKTLRDQMTLLAATAVHDLLMAEAGMGENALLERVLENSNEGALHDGGKE